MIKAIKNIFMYFFRVYNSPHVVTNNEEALKAEKWLKKLNIFFAVFSLLSMAFLFFSFSSIEGFSWQYLLIVPLGVIMGSGYTCMALYFKPMMKYIFTAAKVGYQAGAEIRTTHVNVSHEYGNNYKVTSHTEHKGFLVSLIFGFIAFYFWLVFCLWVAPFCTYIKARKAVKTLQAYRLQNPQN